MRRSCPVRLDHGRRRQSGRSVRSHSVELLAGPVSVVFVSAEDICHGTWPLLKCVSCACVRWIARQMNDHVSKLTVYDDLDPCACACVCVFVCRLVCCSTVAAVLMKMKAVASAKRATCAVRCRLRFSQSCPIEKVPRYSWTPVALKCLSARYVVVIEISHV